MLNLRMPEGPETHLPGKAPQGEPGPRRNANAASPSFNRAFHDLLDEGQLKEAQAKQENRVQPEVQATRDRSLQRKRADKNLVGHLPLSNARGSSHEQALDPLQLPLGGLEQPIRFSPAFAPKVSSGDSEHAGTALQRTVGEDAQKDRQSVKRADIQESLQAQRGQLPFAGLGSVAGPQTGAASSATPAVDPADPADATVSLVTASERPRWPQKNPSLSSPLTGKASPGLKPLGTDGLFSNRSPEIHPDIAVSALDSGQPIPFEGRRVSQALALPTLALHDVAATGLMARTPSVEQALGATAYGFKSDGPRSALQTGSDAEMPVSSGLDSSATLAGVVTGREPEGARTGIKDAADKQSAEASLYLTTAPSAGGLSDIQLSPGRQHEARSFNRPQAGQVSRIAESAIASFPSSFLPPASRPSPFESPAASADPSAGPAYALTTPLSASSGLLNRWRQGTPARVPLSAGSLEQMDGGPRSSTTAVHTAAVSQVFAGAAAGRAADTAIIKSGVPGQEGLADPFLHMDRPAAATSTPVRSATAHVLEAILPEGHGVAGIRAQFGAGQLQASLAAANGASLARLTAQLPAIHQFLGEQGVAVHRLNVEPSEAAAPSGSQPFSTSDRQASDSHHEGAAAQQADRDAGLSRRHTQVSTPVLEIAASVEETIRLEAGNRSISIRA